MIQSSEARQLCSKAEWEMIESSFSPLVETLALSDLKSRSARVGRLLRKITDLASPQAPGASGRTARRRFALFAEVVVRLDANRDLMQAAHRLQPAPRHLVTRKKAEAARRLNMKGLQSRSDSELESRKSHVKSATAVRGARVGAQSGEKRIQSHVGSSARRQQAHRDNKGR